MMMHTVHGADRETGKPVTMHVLAWNSAGATTEANRAGVLVSSVEESKAVPPHTPDRADMAGAVRSGILQAVLFLALIGILISLVVYAVTHQ